MPYLAIFDNSLLLLILLSWLSILNKDNKKIIV
jgi:hypothetical protein